MQRETFDEAMMGNGESYRITDRITGEAVELNRADFDDLCRVHLYDWLEQIPRSEYGWDYRRAAYVRMAERAGGNALKTYERRVRGGTEVTRLRLAPARWHGAERR